MTEQVKFDVYVPGVRAKFEEWIATRGGVKVWKNVNLSDPGAGNIFTPAYQTGTSDSYPKPSWRVDDGEIVDNIGRFRFATDFKELKRIRVSLCRGDGLMYCLTDASQRKVDRALAEARVLYGDNVIYRKDGGLFDYNRYIVIELPKWEAEND